MFAASTMRTIKLAVAGGLLLGGLAAATPAAADPVNLLQNGSFENGLAGWTITGSETQGYDPVAIHYGAAAGYPTGAFGEAVFANPGGSNSPDAAGSRGAYFVSDLSQGQGLSQSLTLAPGTYQVGFSLYLPHNGFANIGDATFTAALGGLTLLDVAASSLPAGVWLNYVSGAMVNVAGEQAVAFSFSTDRMPSKDVVVDQVYLIRGNPDVNGAPPHLAVVPEPASLALFGSGVLGLALLIGRRRRRG